MTRVGRRDSIHSPAVAPVIFHRGWGRLCWEPDGHSTGLESEGRGFEVEHRVTLSTQPTKLMSDGSTQQQYLTASLERRTDGTALRVFIGQNDDTGLEATLGEARRFALDILALVDGPKV